MTDIENIDLSVDGDETREIGLNRLGKGNSYTDHELDRYAQELVKSGMRSSMAYRAAFPYRIDLLASKDSVASQASYLKHNKRLKPFLEKWTSMRLSLEGEDQRDFVLNARSLRDRAIKSLDVCEKIQDDEDQPAATRIKAAAEILKFSAAAITASAKVEELKAIQSSRKDGTATVLIEYGGSMRKGAAIATEIVNMKRREEKRRETSSDIMGEDAPNT